MEYYKQEIKEVLENLVDEGNETKEEIIKRWEDERHEVAQSLREDDDLISLGLI